MKRVLPLLLFASVLVLGGCSKKNNPVTSDPVTPPPATNVTFSMSMWSGSEGMIFIARPNVDVKLSAVYLSYPAGQFADTLSNDNPEVVFPKESNIQLNEYSGVEGGQQWILRFIGKVAATNQPFEVTVHWTVV
jgi:hypothetical protein